MLLFVYISAIGLVDSNRRRSAPVYRNKLLERHTQQGEKTQFFLFISTSKRFQNVDLYYCYYCGRKCGHLGLSLLGFC